jgi:hypothetical protein
MLEWRGEVGSYEKWRNVGCEDVSGWWDSGLAVVQDLGRGGLQLARERQMIKAGQQASSLATMWGPSDTGSTKKLAIGSGGGNGMLLLVAGAVGVYLLSRR